VRAELASSSTHHYYQRHATPSGHMSSLHEPDVERALLPLVSGWPVPHWIPADQYKECHHCHDKFSTGHKHNCRLCGQVRAFKPNGLVYVDGMSLWRSARAYHLLSGAYTEGFIITDC